MLLRICMLPFLTLSALLILSGCNNTFNPLCSSSRPAPMIGSLAPNMMTFAQVQQGSELVVNGSNFVSSTEVEINSTPLAATVVSSSELKLKLSSDVITGPGSVKIDVLTPGGNTSDLGCTSGGKSSTLILTVN
jgi:hypothetical protein